MQFKTATYWICEDTIKSTIDCVYVYDDRAGIDTLFFDDGSIKEIYEYFDWHGRSTLDGYNYFYYVNQTWSNEESATPRIWRDKSKTGSYGGTIILSYLPENAFNQLYWYQDTIKYQGIVSFDTLSSIKFSHSYDFTLNNKASCYLLVKNIGIVQIANLTSNQFQNLVRYSIIK